MKSEISETSQKSSNIVHNCWCLAGVPGSRVKSFILMKKTAEGSEAKLLEHNQWIWSVVT